jgi:hypothetical protein
VGRLLIFPSLGFVIFVLCYVFTYQIQVLISKRHLAPSIYTTVLSLPMDGCKWLNGAQTFPALSVLIFKYIYCKNKILLCFS